MKTSHTTWQMLIALTLTANLMATQIGPPVPSVKANKAVVGALYNQQDFDLHFKEFGDLNTRTDSVQASVVYGFWDWGSVFGQIGGGTQDTHESSDSAMTWTAGFKAGRKCHTNWGLGVSGSASGVHAEHNIHNEKLPLDTFSWHVSATGSYTFDNLPVTIYGGPILTRIDAEISRTIGKTKTGEDIKETFESDNSTNVGILTGVGFHTSKQLRCTIEALFADSQQQYSVGMTYRF